MLVVVAAVITPLIRFTIPLVQAPSPAFSATTSLVVHNLPKNRNSVTSKGSFIDLLDHSTNIVPRKEVLYLKKTQGIHAVIKYFLIRSTILSTRNDQWLTQRDINGPIIRVSWKMVRKSASEKQKIWNPFNGGLAKNFFVIGQTSASFIGWNQHN